MNRGCRTRLISAALVASVILPAVPAAARAHGALRPHGVPRRPGRGACGVERWAVKTGTDPDARLVQPQRVVATTISALRALTPPALLPPLRRIRPVETTVWALDALLVRYRLEADSDVHLVLSDTGGRTLIAEIPDPACVGAASPFRAALTAVRRAFTRAFHPGDPWQRVRVRVHITGVGFFDVEHGQSGVAPNAIELHPVLSMRWGALPATPAPGTRAPLAGATGTLVVRAAVSPDPVPYGVYPVVSARVTPGAVCTARVLYSTGYPPHSFNGFAQTVGGSGVVRWSWHMESRGTGGTATVTCVLHGRAGTTATAFAIT